MFTWLIIGTAVRGVRAHSLFMLIMGALLFKDLDNFTDEDLI